MADGLLDTPALDVATTSGAAGAHTVGCHDILDAAARVEATPAVQHDADAAAQLELQRGAPEFVAATLQPFGSAGSSTM